MAHQNLDNKIIQVLEHGTHLMLIDLWKVVGRNRARFRANVGSIQDFSPKQIENELIQMPQLERLLKKRDGINVFEFMPVWLTNLVQNVDIDSSNFVRETNILARRETIRWIYIKTLEDLGFGDQLTTDDDEEEDRNDDTKSDVRSRMTAPSEISQRTWNIRRRHKSYVDQSRASRRSHNDHNYDDDNDKENKHQSHSYDRELDKAAELDNKEDGEQEIKQDEHHDKEKYDSEDYSEDYPKDGYGYEDYDEYDEESSSTDSDEYDYSSTSDDDNDSDNDNDDDDNDDDDNDDDNDNDDNDKHKQQTREESRKSSKDKSSRDKSSKDKLPRDKLSKRNYNENKSSVSPQQQRPTLNDLESHVSRSRIGESKRTRNVFQNPNSNPNLNQQKQNNHHTAQLKMQSKIKSESRTIIRPSDSISNIMHVPANANVNGNANINPQRLNNNKHTKKDDNVSKRKAKYKETSYKPTLSVISHQKFNRDRRQVYRKPQQQQLNNRSTQHSRSRSLSSSSHSSSDDSETSYSDS